MPANINLNHFRNLVAMASADGNMDEDEKEFLLEKAQEFGIDLAEVNAIINNPSEHYFVAPDELGDREEQLSDAVYIAMIDGEIHEKEYNLCVKFANRLGLSAKDVDEIITLSKKLMK
ncbi:MAG: TerB family tellurite resistance protein [Cytophagales bacterium]|nr:MAG: TerB family tellurite resistance protein [Cytophagales bacterium]